MVGMTVVAARFFGFAARVLSVAIMTLTVRQIGRSGRLSIKISEKILKRIFIKKGGIISLVSAWAMVSGVIKRLTAINRASTSVMTVATGSSSLGSIRAGMTIAAINRVSISVTVSDVMRMPLR